MRKNIMGLLGLALSFVAGEALALTEIVLDGATEEAVRGQLSALPQNAKEPLNVTIASEAALAPFVAGELSGRPVQVKITGEQDWLRAYMQQYQQENQWYKSRLTNQDILRIGEKQGYLHMIREKKEAFFQSFLPSSSDEKRK